MIEYPPVKKQRRYLKERECRRKMVFTSKVKCWFHCFSAFITGGLKIVPYQCDMCGLFHTTSRFKIFNREFQK